MHRNLDRRVEAVVPIKDKRLVKYLKNEFLTAYLKDNLNTQTLKADGNYEEIHPTNEEPPFDSQLYFVEHDI